MGAAIYSLVETCKRFGVEPFDYPQDVLVRAHVHSPWKMHELIPREWKTLRDTCKLAPLDR